jgi:hypothetical protein
MISANRAGHAARRDGIGMTARGENSCGQSSDGHQGYRARVRSHESGKPPATQPGATASA